MSVYRFLTFLFCFAYISNISFNNCNSEDFADKVGGYVVIDSGKEVDTKAINKSKEKQENKKKKELKKQTKQYQKQTYKKNKKLVKDNNTARKIESSKNNIIYGKKHNNKSIKTHNVSTAQKNNACRGNICNINNNKKTSLKQKKNIKKIQKMEFLDDKSIIDLIDEQEAMILTPKKIPVRVKNKGVPKMCIPNIIATKKEQKI